MRLATTVIVCLPFDSFVREILHVEATDTCWSHLTSNPTLWRWGRRYFTSISAKPHVYITCWTLKGREKPPCWLTRCTVHFLWQTYNWIHYLANYSCVYWCGRFRTYSLAGRRVTATSWWSWRPCRLMEFALLDKVWKQLLTCWTRHVCTLELTTMGRQV